MINEQIRQALNEVRPLPIRYSVDELKFMPDDTNRYELIGGKLFVTGMPRVDHQLLISNLFVPFGEYLRKNPIGEIVSAPGVIFSTEDSVIPDFVFATHETIKNKVGRRGEKYDGYFIAAPDLLIEVLTSDKKEIERDRVIKRELYGKYGVKEYWVVDGLFNTIEVYRLGAEGLERIKRFDLHESIETEILPDFSLNLTDIFRF